MSARKSGALTIRADDYDQLPWIDREFRRLPIVDRESGSISITRCLAGYFAYLDGVSITAHGVTWAAFWLALACLATAFGKSTFSYLLTKVQLTQANTSNETVSYAATEVIDRRNRNQGLEPTP